MRSWPELAARLAELGFWSHLAPDQAGAAHREVAAGRYPFSFDELEGRIFHADGEALAEGRVEEFLGVLAPALRPHGVDLTVEPIHLPASAAEEYILAVNGRRCVCWGPGDWADYRAWYLATMRPLAVVNDLLAEAGAPVRCFTLIAGGNEGLALLLNPAIVEAARDSGLIDDDNLPELPGHVSRYDASA